MPKRSRPWAGADDGAPQSSTAADESPVAGTRIEVYWKDSKKYYAGSVKLYGADGRALVHYDDGDVERLELASEKWRLEKWGGGKAVQRKPPDRASKPKVDAPPPKPAAKRSPGRPSKRPKGDVPASVVQINDVSPMKRGAGRPSKQTKGDTRAGEMSACVSTPKRGPVRPSKRAVAFASAVPAAPTAPKSPKLDEGDVPLKKRTPSRPSKLVAADAPADGNATTLHAVRKDLAATRAEVSALRATVDALAARQAAVEQMVETRQAGCAVQ